MEEQKKSGEKKMSLIDMSQLLEEKELSFVYRPNDDSYLFLDALFEDLPNISKISPLISLEIW